MFASLLFPNPPPLPNPANPAPPPNMPPLPPPAPAPAPPFFPPAAASTPPPSSAPVDPPAGVEAGVEEPAADDVEATAAAVGAAPAAVVVVKLGVVVDAVEEAAVIVDAAALELAGRGAPQVMPPNFAGAVPPAAEVEGAGAGAEEEDGAPPHPAPLNPNGLAAGLSAVAGDPKMLPPPLVAPAPKPAEAGAGAEASAEEDGAVPGSSLAGAALVPKPEALEAPAGVVVVLEAKEEKELLPPSVEGVEDAGALEAANPDPNVGGFPAAVPKPADVVTPLPLPLAAAGVEAGVIEGSSVGLWAFFDGPEVSEAGASGRLAAGRQADTRRMAAGGTGKAEQGHRERRGGKGIGWWWVCMQMKLLIFLIVLYVLIFSTPSVGRQRK